MIEPIIIYVISPETRYMRLMEALEEAHRNFLMVQHRGMRLSGLMVEGR